MSTGVAYEIVYHFLRLVVSFATSSTKTLRGRSLKFTTRPTTPSVRDNAVLIIHECKKKSPIVVKHIFDNGAVRPQTISGASDYQYLPSLCPTDVNDEKLLKLANNGVVSLEKLYYLLRGPDKGLKCRNNQPSQFQQLPISVSIGQAAFVAQPPLSKSHDSTELYVKTQLKYKNGIISTQYFHSRCLTLNRAFIAGSAAVDVRHIDINCGICLFSKNSLSTSPGHGNPTGESFVIPHIPRNTRATLYELEIIARLSCSIADVVGIVRHAQQNFVATISVNIDIPEFQYYWTACELLERNVVTVSYAQAWIAAIDKRRSQLAAVIISFLRTMLKHRHLPGVQIRVTPGTEAAALLVKQKVASGYPVLLEDLLQALKSVGTDAAEWSVFLQHLDLKHHPLNVPALGKLMYVYKSVKPAIRTDSSADTDNGRDEFGNCLLLQIDDINEWRILDQAKKFLKSYSKKRADAGEEIFLAGLFPMQKIFAVGEGRSDLYLQDPGPLLRWDKETEDIDPLDVIGSAYGQWIKTELRRACLGAGLN